MYMSTWPLDATMEAKECRSPWSGLKVAGSPAAAWILLTGRLMSFLWRPPRPGMTKCTFSRVSFQGFPRRLVHRDDLIWSAFWVSDMDEAALEIDVLPPQFEEFPPAHPREKCELHQVPGLKVGFGVKNMQELAQLIRL